MSRLDKWLFHARFCRTRALAQAAAAAGRVRLNGRRVEKPAQMVKPGDVLTLGRGAEVMASLPWLSAASSGVASGTGRVLGAESRSQ